MRAILRGLRANGREAAESGERSGEVDRAALEQAAAAGYGEGLFPDKPTSSASGPRSVLIAHAFVAGGRESESERPLTVGGSGAVDPACFSGFHYVALGHLHRPQTAGAAHIRYSGSLFKYSFDEADQPKSVSIVELDSSGRVNVETVTLNPRREVRRLEGRLADLLASPPATGAEDYLMVILLDEGPVYDAIGRLREIYPNVLHIERPSLLAGGDEGGGPSGAERLRMDDLELFKAFFEEVTGQELTGVQAEVFTEVVEDLRRREREASR